MDLLESDGLGKKNAYIIIMVENHAPCLHLTVAFHKETFLLPQE